jgi:uncharacterized HAD superfamily protein
MIAVDIDNTICDTLTVLRRRLSPPLVAERVVDWEPYGATPEFWSRYGNEVFMEAEPYPGAVEAVRALAMEEGVAYISARPRSAGRTTADWLERWGFPVIHAAIDVRDKAGMARDFRCRLAIEDDPRQIAAYQASGMPVLVPYRGYNADVAGAWRFEEWYEVLIHFPLPRRREVGGRV